MIFKTYYKSVIDILLCVFVIVVFYITRKDVAFKTFSNRFVFNDISNLPSEENFNNTNTIFFIEGFFNDYIRGRYLCSIESAAKIHPNSVVNVMMTSRFLKLTPPIKSLLKAYKNVRFLHLNATKLYLEEPSLRNFYNKKRWVESQWPRMYFCNPLRFLLLWKYGGIYLDLDVMPIKNLVSGVKNFVGYTSEEHVNSAPLGFLPYHKFIRDCLEEIPKFYDPTHYGTIGPLLVTKVLKEKCGLKPPSVTPMERCPDIKVYERKVLNPISWWRANKSFERDTSLAERLMDDPQILTLHYWNIITKQYQHLLIKESPFSILAKKFCPNVFQFSKDNF
ncbi:UNVERIFIED_CONTAM: hypothetical protein RMT77_018861 [Armadillidium vulgare]